MDEAERMADRVAIIDHGKLLIVDTPEALKRTVGEGDVLEIEVNWRGRRTRRGGRGPHRARGLDDEPHTGHPGAGRGGNVAAILDALRGADARPGEVRLRANTLEDVFISLTGRRLRE